MGGSYALLKPEKRSILGERPLHGLAERGRVRRGKRCYVPERSPGEIEQAGVIVVDMVVRTILLSLQSHSRPCGAVARIIWAEPRSVQTCLPQHRSYSRPCLGGDQVTTGL